MKVSKEEIMHIANLADLNLKEEEIGKYILNLQDILGFANIVNNAPIDGVEESIGALESSNAFRKDEASQQRMKQEMMLIYKKYKFNPLGCVFTMFIQFPIFVSMYEVVRRINLTQIVDAGNGVLVETFGKFALADTKLFGFFELNGTSATQGEMKDRILCVVIALLYAGITFLSQKLAQRKPSYMRKTSYNVKGNDQAKQMRIMNIVMIVMFFFIALSSTALGIYWLIGAIYQIFQSYIGRKMNERAYYKMKKESMM